MLHVSSAMKVVAQFNDSRGEKKPGTLFISQRFPQLGFWITAFTMLTITQAFFPPILQYLPQQLQIAFLWGFPSSLCPWMQQTFPAWGGGAQDVPWITAPLMSRHPGEPGRPAGRPAHVTTNTFSHRGFVWGQRSDPSKSQSSHNKPRSPAPNCKGSC